MSEKPLRLEWIPAADLQANPNNWRRHPEMQRDALEALLYGEDAVGWAGAALYNETTGRLIDGHLRREMGIIHDEPIPVLIGSWTEEEEKRILATLDPIAAMAEANREVLGALLQDVQSSEQAVQALLGELAEREGVVFGGNEQPPEDPEPQVDRASELQEKWQVQTGDLWVIPSKTADGEHRVICGDCTDGAVVERVMGGRLADMVFTDPPYNVSYQDNESIESLKARNRRIDGLTVSNDAMTDEKFDEFLLLFLSLLPLKAGGIYYLCAPPGHPETQFRNALICVSGLSLRQCIVWVKDVLVFGRQDYHWRHESILYGWKDGAAHYFIDDRTQDTVWEIERPRQSKEHPTMKPLELSLKAIQNSSKPGDIVFDGFLGSGTTLLACELIKRRGVGIEIDPAYCAVTLERLKTLGLDPQRID